MTITTTRWDSAEYLKTTEDMLLYLEACLEEAGDDPAFIAHALDVINRSRKKYESVREHQTRINRSD
jgi:DNA-binding phage protein